MDCSGATGRVCSAAVLLYALRTFIIVHYSRAIAKGYMIGAFRALGLSTSPSPFYPCWAVMVEGLPGHMITLSQWCTCANNHTPPTCAATCFDIISCIRLFFFPIYDTVLIVITCVQTKRITKTLCMFASLFFSFDQMEIKTYLFLTFFEWLL